MKRKELMLFCFLFLTFGCSYENYKNRLSAEVVAFHAEKCMCCWGWDIKIGNNLIRTESGKVGNIVGYEINKPVPVLLILGEKEEDCSSRITNIDFYEVIDIKLIE